MPVLSGSSCLMASQYETAPSEDGRIGCRCSSLRPAPSRRKRERASRRTEILTPRRKQVIALTLIPRGSAVPADGDDLAVSRIRFLTAEPAEPSRVRPAILASWRRSRDLNVAADKVELPYIGDPDIDSRLTRSAEPVLRRLHEQLDGQAVSIILTDQTGLVLSRRSADAELDRHLDSVLLAPGFSYAEQFVGTNGIGTALEAGTATHVFGHEHYAENLEDLACAGVPILHPISGRTVGAVDLTCWRKDAESLLLTLAKTTAEQIRQELLADSGMHELELFQAYRRTCRRIAGIVFALTDDVVMLNDHARAMLDPADQAALLAQATEALTPGRRGSVDVRLPTGVAARMYCQQVCVGTQLAGVVVHVKLGESESQHAGARDVASRMLLPGLVGHAPLWLRACHEVETAFLSGEWLAVEGEPGVGKLALLRAVQVRGQPGRRFAVLDVSDFAADPHWMTSIRSTLVDGADSVVIRHVDMLDGRRLRALWSALQDARTAERERPLWVAVTLGNTTDNQDLVQLLRLFPTTVEVPPLRLHLEDLAELVSLFLARLGHGNQMACSAEAMRVLLRSSWPGNVEQVHELLHEVVQHRRAGIIQPGDLPPAAQTLSRRLLSPLESMERDAIVTSLSDAHGNKVKAARSLGMSRATIYRKIHEYGIVAQAVSSSKEAP
jgi:transcriptional regulator of acetoin/glycerol metabolism